jgi:hypothetical protein
MTQYLSAHVIQDELLHPSHALREKSSDDDEPSTRDAKRLSCIPMQSITAIGLRYYYFVGWVE